MTIIRRQFDENSDMQLNTFVSESQATMQAIVTRLRFFKGEWFLDLSDGTDYWGKIFVKPVNLNIAELEIKNRILQTDGVKELTSFSFNYNKETREMVYEFAYTDDWGNIISSTDLNGINRIKLG